MDIISTIYLKELSNINEIFKQNCRLPSFFKKLIVFLKKFFCIVTINKDGICVLPYNNLNSFLKIKLFLIKKILIKLDAQIVLSKKLDNIQELKNMVKNLNIKIIEGIQLSNYLMPEIIGRYR